MSEPVRRGARGLAALAFAALVLGPTPARANFWDIYGFNPRAIGLAGTHTAIADDFTAIHYNPAGLTAARGVGFGFALAVTRPSLSLDFDRPPQIQPLDPPNATAITFGSTFSLAGDGAAGRITLGLGISVPTRSLLNGQALDPAIPHWTMYHALPERIVANLGVGVLPLEWLSLGLGVQLLAGLGGELDYELDVVAGRFSRKTVLFEISPQAAPIVGLELRPIEGLRVGATYRRRMSADVDLPVSLVVTGLADLRVDTSFVVQYMPDQVALGASYRYEPWGLLASAEVTWAAWSQAPDPSVSSRLDVGGSLFEGTGIADALDVPAPGEERSVDLAFRDIWIPRVGVEKDLGDFTLRAGYALRPSPAPLQTSGTNYVDGTAHHIGLGSSLRWTDPWGLFRNPLIADLGLQAVVLPERGHQKIDANDPVGSFRASGVIWVFGFALRYLFEEKDGRTPAPAIRGPAPAPTR